MSGQDATDAASRDARDVPARVLVVDDEPAIRRLVVRAIARDGIDIVEAGDGRSAIEIVRADPTGLVLIVCDLWLPDVGGGEVVRVARALRPDLAVIVMTGFDRGRAAEALGDAGPVRWVAKPFTIAQLRAAVDAVISR